ncbi:uncharacterized protein BDV17DRAFT_290795 [Aspergillus undulatus]|uniref:uncharacterized protein n=1 Tax=Aspergillus undulatus TaxID=1810928 RepID=UPI003CCE09AB
MSTTTTLLTLPFLALISIPLVLTASITIILSAIALFVQLSVITIQLCYALLTNLFTVPPSTDWSLLSFSASVPNTPDRRYSSDFGILHTPLAFWGQSQTRPSLGQRRGSSNPFLDSPDNQHQHHNAEVPPYSLENRHNQSFIHSHSHSHSHSSTNHRRTNSFHVLGLINGDEGRDFEGLGGWRCPPSYTKSPGYRSGRTTPSSSGGGVNDEIDDMAWCSMNSRLELPSQPLMLRHSASNHNLFYGLGHGHNGDASKTEAYLPRRKNSRASLSHAAAGAGPGDSMRGMNTNMNQGARHHRRSATTGTNLLTGSGSGSGHGSIILRGISPTTSTSQAGFGLPNRQSQSQSQSHGSRPTHQTAIQSRGDPLRSKSHISLSDWAHQYHQHTGSIASSLSLSSASAGGSYFALQPMSASPDGGARTTTNTTPNEGRKPARIITNTTSLAQGASGGVGKAQAQHQDLPSLGSR